MKSFTEIINYNQYKRGEYMQISNNVLIKVQDSDIKNGTFEIPQLVTGIADWAFQYSKKLEYIKIPENVKYLGHGIFDNCINLKKVYLSKNITELPYSAFNSCDSLEKIEVAEDNKKYYSRNGVLYNKALTELVVCPAQREKILLPETITTIKRNAFMGCSKIKRIKLPEGLKTIEGCAFSRCTNLTELQLPTSLKNLDYFTFFCSNIKQIVVLDETIKFDYSVLENCSNLKTIVIKGKTDKGIPIPNCKEVFDFLNNKTQKVRNEIIENAIDSNVQTGLALYLLENKESDFFTDKIVNNLYSYGKFIIDNSGNNELKNLLKSNILLDPEYSTILLNDLKRLQQYYTKQKTIELDLKRA